MKGVKEGEGSGGGVEKGRVTNEVPLHAPHPRAVRSPARILFIHNGQSTGTPPPPIPHSSL